MIDEGDMAPGFSLKGIDANGKEKEFNLSDFKGKKVVLYFYPKDNTPGCTQEACDFRDNMNRLKKEAVAVLGVSPDSITSHQGFREKQGITFPLLSDPDSKVAGDYGAYGEKVMYGKKTMGTIRSTFLIDESGKIKKVWRKIKVQGHVDEILLAI